MRTRLSSEMSRMRTLICEVTHGIKTDNMDTVLALVCVCVSHYALENLWQTGHHLHCFVACKSTTNATVA